jgi:hypothetical protein
MIQPTLKAQPEKINEEQKPSKDNTYVNQNPTRHHTTMV